MKSLCFRERQCEHTEYLHYKFIELVLEQSQGMFAIDHAHEGWVN